MGCVWYCSSALLKRMGLGCNATYSLWTGVMQPCFSHPDVKDVGGTFKEVVHSGSPDSLLRYMNVVEGVFRIWGPPSSSQGGEPLQRSALALEDLMQRLNRCMGNVDV